MNCTQVSEVLPPSAVGRLACLTPPKRKDNPFARMLEHAKPEEPATALPVSAPEPSGCSFHSVS